MHLYISRYSPEGRKELVAGGASEAGKLYDSMLRTCDSKDISTTIVYPSDPSFDLKAIDLSSFHAVAWTGCSLCINDKDDPRVKAQVKLAQNVFEIGLPQFGSCKISLFV